MKIRLIKNQRVDPLTEKKKQNLEDEKANNSGSWVWKYFEIILITEKGKEVEKAICIVENTQGKRCNKEFIFHKSTST